MIEPEKLSRLEGGQKRRKLALTFGALERDIAGIAEKGMEFNFKNISRAEYTKKITQILLTGPKLPDENKNELELLLKSENVKINLMVSPYCRISYKEFNISKLVNQKNVNVYTTDIPYVKLLISDSKEMMHIYSKFSKENGEILPNTAIGIWNQYEEIANNYNERFENQLKKIANNNVKQLLKLKINHPYFQISHVLYLLLKELTEALEQNILFEFRQCNLHQQESMYSIKYRILKSTQVKQ